MLTPEQMAERKKGIGGSDAAKILSGEWFGLWLEKTGRAEPEDLSDNFSVQLGIVTETLNLDWYEKKAGHPVTRRGEQIVHPEHKILRCTLDGLDAIDKRVVQAKHCNGFAKLDEVRVRYTPQVLHECLCAGTGSGVLSVIFGTNEPVRELIEMDEFWANEYVERCYEFWKFVETDKEPPGRVAEGAAPVQPAVMRVVSMQDSNAWGVHAADWLQNVGPAKKFEKATKELKALVEADVREAKGHGIVCTRNKAGSLTIKEDR